MLAKPLRYLHILSLYTIALIGSVLCTCAALAQGGEGVLRPYVVGPETPVCPMFGPAPGNQHSVELASSPHGCLAVWQDYRGSNGSDIFAARIALDGTVLDPSGIAVCAAPTDQTDPCVAWNGQEYLVVWADRRGGRHIYAARVRPDGEVIDKNGLLISGTRGEQASPRVASDGSGWVVVWQDLRSSSYDIYGCKFNQDGVISKVYGISTRLDNEETPDIAWGGSSYIAVWRDFRNGADNPDIYGCRIGRNGVRLGGDILISCDSTGASGYPGEQKNPRICSIGSGCMVIWEDYRNNAEESDLYGARVTSAGVVQDRNGIAICKQADDQELSCVECNGNRILVVWRNRSNRTVKAARLDMSGYLLDSNPIAVSSGLSGGRTAICCFGSAFLVGWSTLSLGDTNVVMATVSPGGAVTNSAGATVSLAQYRQIDHSVVDSGNCYVVAWSQLIDGRYNILVAKVGYDGSILTPEPVRITPGFYADATQPAIAWNGSRYLVVWRDSGSFAATDWDIRGCLLDSGLNVLSQTPLNICQAVQSQARPCVASNGSNFFAAWEDSRAAIAPYYYNDIYGAMISSTGAVTPCSTTVGPGAGNQCLPRAASDGSAYYVVWEDYRNGYPLVYGTKVMSNGQVLTSQPMPATSYSQTCPDICFGGGNYFVVWDDYYAITGCRINTAGAIQDLGGISIDSGTRDKSSPSVCWDGTVYHVAWEDYRSSYAENSDIYHCIVTSDGSVDSGSKMPLISDLYPQRKPRLFGKNSEGMLFYSNYINYGDCIVAAHLSQQDGLQVERIAELKSVPVGSVVSLENKVVTAVFPDCFYIQDADRSSGIKIVSAGSVQVDDMVDISGAIASADGERYINAWNVAIMGQADEPPVPLGIRSDCLGGAALNSYTPGITGAFGPHNIGLLVQTWGKVVERGSGWFVIENRPPIRVKVRCETMVSPAVGDFVSVTGISSCDVVEGATVRVLRARSSSEIRKIK